MKAPRPCVVCRLKPRSASALCCDDESCVDAVLRLPTEEIESIRLRESIEHLRNSPNGRFYFHARLRSYDK